MMFSFFLKYIKIFLNNIIAPEIWKQNEVSDGKELSLDLGPTLIQDDFILKSLT